MVFVVKNVIQLWRERLAYLERCREQGQPEHHSQTVERRILRFCLQRYADGPCAEMPASAQRLDPESARRSERLFLGTMPRRPALKAIVRDHFAARASVRREVELLRAEVEELKGALERAHPAEPEAAEPLPLGFLELLNRPIAEEWLYCFFAMLILVVLTLIGLTQ